MPVSGPHHEWPLKPEQAVQLQYEWRSRVHAHEVAIRPFRHDDADDARQRLPGLIAAIEMDIKTLQTDVAEKRRVAKSLEEEYHSYGAPELPITEHLLLDALVRYDCVVQELTDELERLHGLSAECREIGRKRRKSPR